MLTSFKEEGKPSPKENDKPEKRDTEHISNSNNNKGREDNRKEKERDGEQPAGKKKEDKRLKGIKIEEHKISISDLGTKLRVCGLLRCALCYYRQRCKPRCAS